MDWDWLTDWLNAAWAWLIDLLLWVPLQVYGLALDGLATVLEAIPAPEWIVAADFSGVHPAIAYFGGAFEIGYGISALLSAMVLRFVIRRIPVIG